MAESKKSGCEYLQHALSIVVVGASGDLAKKKTFPALLDLYRHDFLPKSVTICGYSRSKMSDEDLRTKIKPFLVEKDAAPDAVVEEFLGRVYYRSGGYGSVEAMSKMVADLEVWEGQTGDKSLIVDSENKTVKHGQRGANRVYYFAIPPNVFLDTAASIKQVGLSATGFTRLVVEKPFGHDYDSALKLTDDLRAHFDESYVYRIDHYLGKEMTQNLLVLRFSNTMFEPIWNRNSVQSVTFTFKENFGTEGRGGYFDRYGIIRDVIQNHLMQVFTLIAMEQPIRVSGSGSADYVRDAKVAVLKAIEPVRAENVVLGQYLGSDDGTQPGYKDDDGVPDDSNTPTFATCVLFVKNRRWDGVPFIFKAGKALNETKAEVRVQFKDVPSGSFLFDDKPLPRNELVMKLKQESIYFKTNVKAPGLANRPIQSELDLSYGERYPSLYSPDAYTRLVLEVLRGKQATFVRSDELLESWKIFTPVLSMIDAGEIPPLPYKFGTRGPKESDELIEKMGYTYNKNYDWEEAHKEYK
ncbi:unnamed protein product [Ectocarpus sp. 4 AP-2014]